MANYRLTTRTFSRQWRRSKLYSDKEIRWLARKRNLTLKDERTAIQVLDRNAKVVAAFQQVDEAEAPHMRKKSNLYAALKLGLWLLCALPAAAQTYEEKVIAAVLMGEAWGEGTNGMTAVAEVIHQRSVDKQKTLLQIVTTHSGHIHAFSCLNGTSPSQLISKFKDEPDFQKALEIAKTACRTPDQLPGTTKHANHFTRTDETPWWAKNKKAVAVVGNHSFYRMERY
jgi:spore germination cell wall hydrolase CwlJ-like protein